MSIISVSVGYTPYTGPAEAAEIDPGAVGPPGRLLGVPGT